MTTFIASIASNKALCRIRVRGPSLVAIETSATSSSTPRRIPLVAFRDCVDVPPEKRKQWAAAITEKFDERQESDQGRGIRDWDLVLDHDGTVTNINSPFPTRTYASLLKKETQPKAYPARYRIPNSITDRLSSSEEKTRRAELFALGGLLYELASDKRPFHDLGDTREDSEEIQSRYTQGDFPDDVWGLPMAVEVLGSWCPEFKSELLASGAMGNYIRNHPVKFSFMVLGGIVSIASLAVVPVLGAVGFSAIGPVAGSTAAAWQACIGLVGAGTIFAWCQSVSMGGAAVGSITATGLTGMGVAISAGVAGAGTSRLKKRFLAVWRREIREEA